MRTSGSGDAFAISTRARGAAFTAIALMATAVLAAAQPAAAQQSVARRWNELLLDAIRRDYPAPTVHSRNLFNVSAAMWDAWAAYDRAHAQQYYVDETATAEDVEAARAEAMSFVAFRILKSRFVEPKSSPGAVSFAATAFPALMTDLGYDPGFTATSGGVDPPAELGNRIAAAVIAQCLGDGANEAGGYGDPTYVPANPPMLVDLPGVLQGFAGLPPPELPEPNRWQPLALDMVTQNGIPLPDKIQTFLGARWGGVAPFAMTRASASAVHHDQGPPPLLGCEGARPCESEEALKAQVVDIIRKSSELDPDDGATIDIGPGAWGNSTLGTNDGTGYAVNPKTGQPYAPNVVLRADFERVLAEYWADGPTSETPPGHWNTIANYVSDNIEKRIGGTGPVVTDLEWDVKLYFALNGAVYDAAIAAWDHKRVYDTSRPVTLVRYMGGKGQSSDPEGPSYHPLGLPLVPGLIEVVTQESSAPGERHANVRDESGDPAIGQVAIYAWPGQPADPETQYSGARWIRAVAWVPYQRNNFVTPPFAAYVSGHSTFSRSAAEVLVRFTGDEYFPGGMGTFTASQDTYLAFEIGPTQTVELQWARYYDAADQAGISRLFGGIHIEADDFGGRRAGAEIGAAAYEKAITYFVPEPAAALGAISACAALAALRRRSVAC